MPMLAFYHGSFPRLPKFSLFLAHSFTNPAVLAQPILGIQLHRHLILPALGATSLFFILYTKFRPLQQISPLELSTLRPPV